MKLSFSFSLDISFDQVTEKLVNENGLIPWWFIAVTFPVPGITAPMIAYNVGRMASNRAK